MGLFGILLGKTKACQTASAERLPALGSREGSGDACTPTRSSQSYSVDYRSNSWEGAQFRRQYLRGAPPPHPTAPTTSHDALTLPLGRHDASPSPSSPLSPPPHPSAPDEWPPSPSRMLWSHSASLRKEPSAAPSGEAPAAAAAVYPSHCSPTPSLGRTFSKASSVRASPLRPVPAGCAAGMAEVMGSGSAATRQPAAAAAAGSSAAGCGTAAAAPSPLPSPGRDSRRGSLLLQSTAQEQQQQQQQGCGPTWEQELVPEGRSLMGSRDCCSETSRAGLASPSWGASRAQLRFMSLQLEVGADGGGGGGGGSLSSSESGSPVSPPHCARHLSKLSTSSDAARKAYSRASSPAAGGPRIGLGDAGSHGKRPMGHGGNGIDEQDSGTPRAQDSSGTPRAQESSSPCTQDSSAPRTPPSPPSLCRLPSLRRQSPALADTVTALRMSLMRGDRGLLRQASVPNGLGGGAAAGQASSGIPRALVSSCEELADTNATTAAMAAASAPFQSLTAPAVGYVHPLRSDGHPVKVSAATCGITVKYLLTFAADVAQATGGGEGAHSLPRWPITTAQVVKDFVMPKVEGQRCRLADMAPRQHAGMRPQLYVSHDRSGSFAGLVNAIVRFCECHGLATASTAVFVDFFSVNLCSPGWLPGCLAALQRIVAKSQSVLLVVDHRGAALSSLWCCFEAWLAVFCDATAAAAAAAAAADPSATAAGHVRADRLQVVYDHADIETMLPLVASLHSAASMREGEAGERAAIEAHLEALSVDGVRHTLPAMLPAVRAAMQQSAESHYVLMATMRDHRRVQFLEAAACHSTMLILAGRSSIAEQSLQQDVVWAKRRLLPSLDLLRPMMNTLAVLLKGVKICQGANAESHGCFAEAERMCLEALSMDASSDATGLPFLSSEVTLADPLVLCGGGGDGGGGGGGSGGGFGVADHMLLLNLEDVLYRAGDIARSRELCRRLLGPSVEANFKVAVAHATTRPSHHLAAILSSEGDDAGAERVLEDALQAVMAGSGPHGADAATCQFHLAMHLMAAAAAAGPQGRVAELLEASAQTRRALFGKDHALTLEVKLALAGLLVANGQWEAAEPAVEAVYVAAMHTFGGQHSVTRAAFQHCGTLQEAYLQEARASNSHGLVEALLRRALHMSELVCADGVAILIELAQVLRHQGKASEARQLDLRVTAFMREAGRRD